MQTSLYFLKHFLPDLIDLAVDCGAAGGFVPATAKKGGDLINIDASLRP
jgi:hypothetical protein